MDTADLLTESFDRLRGLVPTLVEGLDADALAQRPQGPGGSGGSGGQGNSIAWLVWHLTRVQDDHVSDAAGTDQAWEAEGWRARLALDLPAQDTGYGHSGADVDAVRTSGELLAGYHAAVAGRTARYVAGLGPADLDRVVDDAWDPPVTLGVRLVSVTADCLQHAGQAAYVRGLLHPAS